MFFGFLLFAMGVHLPQARAQAVGAATSPVGDLNPEDQPLEGQQLGTDLRLNQGIQAENAESESIHRFGVGMQTKSGEETNLFGSEVNPKNAIFADFSADLAVRLHSRRARFFALYQPEYDFFPQYTKIDNFQQRYFQKLDYQISQRSLFTWNITGARYLSLNEFLPQSLAIGAIGLVIPTLENQLLQNSYEITDAATELMWRYLASARSTFTASLTGSWFLLAPAAATNLSGIISERFMASGADFKYLYQLTPHDSIGIEATPLYMYGLGPSGHNTDETLEVLYQRQINATWSVQLGAGPLFAQSSGSLYGSVHELTYAVNAGLTHQIRKAQFSLNYQRALLLSFLAPAEASHEISLDTHIPLGRNWILTSDFVYLRELGSIQAGSGTIYGGSGQIAYQIGSRTQLFAQGSTMSESFNIGLPQPYAFTQNQFGGGIRFNVGRPITRGGMY